MLEFDYRMLIMNKHSNVITLAKCVACCLLRPAMLNNVHVTHKLCIIYCNLRGRIKYKNNAIKCHTVCGKNLEGEILANQHP